MFLDGDAVALSSQIGRLCMLPSDDDRGVEREEDPSYLLRSTCCGRDAHDRWRPCMASVQVSPRSSEADGSCRTPRDGASFVVGNRHPNGIPVTDSAALAADPNDTSDRRERQNRQDALPFGFECEPKPIGSEHRWWWRENARGLHKVLGSRNTHEQKRVANGLCALATAPRQSQYRQPDSRSRQKAAQEEPSSSGQAARSA